MTNSASDNVGRNYALASYDQLDGAEYRFWFNLFPKLENSSHMDALALFAPVFDSFAFMELAVDFTDNPIGSAVDPFLWRGAAIQYRVPFL